MHLVVFYRELGWWYVSNLLFGFKMDFLINWLHGGKGEGVYVYIYMCD